MIGRWQTKVVHVALLVLCVWAVPNVGCGQGGGLKTYCVLDLSAGAAAAKFPVTYLDAEPAGGFDTAEYKTTKLVLKRVEPGAFVMGADQADEAHRVRISKPFYLGLFEVTQKQWECVMGSMPDYYSITEANRRQLGDTLPVGYVTHTMIRGDAQDASYETNVGTDDTFLVRLRAKTDLAFDLPTEAQWEYACRASTTTAYSYGDEPDGAYMWYFDNSNYAAEMRFDVHEVGTKKPNPWGFYDMHGNAQEWCRDVFVKASQYPYGTDPFVTVLTDNTDRRVVRGGLYRFDADMVTSAYRSWCSRGSISTGYGFRLGLDVGGVAKTYGPFVPGEQVSIALPDLVGYAAKGLPAGLKFNAKTGAITGAATKPTGETGVTVTFTKKGAETYTTRFVVGPFPVLSVDAPGAPAGCKVTGAGAYAAARKVTLRATAAKGFVFAGWYADAACSAPLAGDVDFRTPSLPYVMPTGDVSLFAKFVALDADAAALSVPAVGECAPKAAIGPIALDVAGCVSLPTVKITGLPPGLKFTAKVLDVKATKTTPAAHYAANTIYGTPTKSGVYAATVAVTTAGKRTATAAVTFVVIDREKGERVLKVVCDEGTGKVSGAGVYAAGKKVTLRATAAKGFVPAGWYVDAACTAPLEDEGGLDFRTPTFPYVMPERDATVYAAFVPSDQDASSIGLRLVARNNPAYWTTEEANDIRFYMPSSPITFFLDVASASLPRVVLTGLPPGLKFTAKALDVKAKKTAPAAHYAANTAYGTATKPGTYVVTAKITNATVKKAVTRRFTIIVDNQTDANERLRVTDAGGGVTALQNGRGEKYTVYAGVAEHDLPAIAVRDPADKLTLSGLPSGLKFTAKQLLNRDGTVLAKANTIYGVPTKAGTYTVTATVQSGRASFVSTFTIVVAPLPEWTVGTFVGSGFHRIGDYMPFTNNLHGTITVASNGKVSGKVIFDTGDDRLLTASFSEPSLTGYDMERENYYCDVYLVFKDGRNIVDAQVRRLYIASESFVPYGQRIGSAWMGGCIDEETGMEVGDDFTLNLYQNVWKRKGFESLPKFAAKKTTVSATGALLPSSPEDAPGKEDLTLDIAPNGAVTATLAFEDGGRVKRSVAKGDLIVHRYESADVSASGKPVYAAYVSLVFGKLGLLYTEVEMKVSEDGKVYAKDCAIVGRTDF